MFNNTLILEVGGNYINEYKNNRIIEHDLASFQELGIYVKRKRVYIILSGEEINIRLLKFPKIKEKELYDLINNELYYNFRNTDNLVFAYTLIKSSNINDEFAVFCLNMDKIALIEKSVSFNTNIKGVYLLQFCILNFFKAKIKNRNFIFLFKYMENIYLLHILNDVVIHNTVFKDYGIEEDLLFEFNKFIEEVLTYTDKNIDMVYTLNMSKDQYLNLVEDKLKFEDLGDLNIKRIIRSII